MTRAEILQLAAIELRDTSPNFISDVLNPAFDLVLLELAAKEAIGCLRDSHPFDVRQDQRDYETREITGLTPHVPSRILSLIVHSWGLSEGKIPRAPTDDQFEDLRLSEGEDVRGRWRMWRVHPNRRLLQVTPMAGENQDRDQCQVTFERPPHLIALDQDLPEFEAEDTPTIVAGLRAHGAVFGEDTLAQLPAYIGLFNQGAMTMWGRRWNNRPGRIRGVPF